jgi:hypothetical protein
VEKKLKEKSFAHHFLARVDEAWPAVVVGCCLRDHGVGAKDKQRKRYLNENAGTVSMHVRSYVSLFRIEVCLSATGANY